MRFSFLFVALLSAFSLFGANTGFADDLGRPEVMNVPETVAVAPVPVKWSLSETVVDQYVIDNGVVLSDQPCIQSSLTASWGKGWSANMWWSIGLDDGNLSSTYADEIDLSISWSSQLGWLSVSGSLAYFDLIDLNATKGDILSPNVELSHSFKVNECVTLTPFVKLDEYLFLPNLSADDGILRVSAGLKTSWKVSECVTLSSRAALVDELSQSDNTWGPTTLVVGVNLDWKISNDVSVGILGKVFVREDNGPEYVAGINVTFSF